MTTQELWEIAHSFYCQTHFEKALPYLKELSKVTLFADDVDTHIKALHYQLRCYAEREEFEDVARIEGQILSLLNSGQELPSEAYYVLCLASRFQGQNQKAKSYAEKALSLAVTSKNSKDMLHAFFALALMEYVEGNLKAAEELIEKAQTILSCSPENEIAASFAVVKCYIHISKDELESALGVLWAHQETVTQSRNLNLLASLQYNIALCYWEMKDHTKAALFLGLAKNFANEKNHARLYREISALSDKLGIHPLADYDLVFKKDGKTVIERSRGAVNFHSQFILLDLLKLMAKEPGRVFKKEELAATLWNEGCNDVVDNRLYVTIRRLRDLIEPDKHSPRYIRRSKGGYTLNHECRIQFEGELS
ncbi:hypothetical protein D3C87_259430 [compost metagenome]